MLFVVIGVLATAIDAKKKRKFEGDFEFAEEVSLLVLFLFPC